MKKRKTWSLTALFVVACFIGCDDPIYQSSTDGDTQDSNGPSNEPDSQPEPTPEPEPDSQPEPEPTPEPTDFCLPKPSTSNQGYELPDLRGWMEAALEDTCTIASIIKVDGFQGEEATTLIIAPGTVVCTEDDRCSEMLPTIARAWEVRGSLGAELWTGTLTGSRETGVNDPTLSLRLRARPSSHSVDQTFEQKYDGQGRLVYESWSSNDEERREVFNTWSGRNLVETVITTLGNGWHTTEAQWTYNDRGMMVSGSYTDDRQPGTTHEAQWRYDAQDRPIEVVRKIDGQMWLRQNWTFEGSRLTARTITTYRSSVARYFDVDDMMPTLGYYSSDTVDIWSASTVRSSDGCRRLPTSVAHGYPEVEHVYNLGWPISERPNRIGFDYGYNGFGFRYGTTSWFGHGGTGEILAYPEGEALVTLRYNEAGQMVSETIEATLNEGEVRTQERSRDIVEGRVLSDVATFTQTNSEGTRRWSTELEFGYDAAGRLTDRRHIQGGNTLAHHAWSHDDEGRLTGHVIAHHTGLTGALPLTPEQLEGIPEEMDAVVSYRQLWSGQSMTRTKHVEDEVLETEQWRDEVTEQGHLIQSWFLGRLTSRIYDDLGRLTLLGGGAFDEMVSQMTYDYTSANADLLEREELFNNRTSQGTSTLYNYICE